jgi:hypothetical protein
MRHRLSAVAICIACAVAWAPPLRAQADTLGYATRAPAWVAHFTTISANALLGALTGGVIQELRGGSFKDGFARGALGGAIIYSGKRITAERFFGAGFIGREVAAVGSSVVRNASDGIGTFDRLILPAGFLRLYWQRGSGELQVKVDVYSAGLVVYGIAEDDLELDTRASLSAGAAVFRTDNEVITFGSEQKHAGGVSRGGIILRSYVPGWGKEFLDRALAHERVHVAQDDQLFITLNDRLDDWVFTKLGPARPLSRYIDLNGSSEFLRLLTRVIPRHGDRPWELEAIYLTR